MRSGKTLSGFRATHIRDLVIRGRSKHTQEAYTYRVFPKSESALSNEYVQGGYEASFGSYEVNEESHTVTHHVEGSITRALVGKDLPRVYQFSDGHLIIKSARPDEHWSVAWEHY
jgi:hypothetical protein